MELCPVSMVTLIQMTWRHNAVRGAKGRSVGGAPASLHLPDKSVGGQKPGFWHSQMDVTFFLSFVGHHRLFLPLEATLRIEGSFH